MYMLQSVVSVAVFAAAAIAQSTNLAFTSFPPTTVAAGSPITLNWIGGDSTAPVTITLKKGLSTDLKDVGVITSTATGGSYTWTPDTTIGDGADYALAISQGSVINYTGQFSVTGGSTAAATTASTSASTPASASSSAAPSSAANSSTESITSAAAALSTTASSSNGTISSAALSSTDSSASTTGSSTLRTSSATRTPSSSGSTASSSNVPATGAASGLQSPIALFFGVVAAMLYLQ
ncbi:extracellular matrix protein [Venturia nashicola]|uniref:Extracellular matrix protein n=1 Tax=Venturia nashicola TaxID=86259 RepID=A0A4Z1NYB2_9PEZI|nr:extracellular matrix protein [Venturia nashicola]TLD24588.1 extracellular matrix protein [Venturia nashicola]